MIFSTENYSDVIVAFVELFHSPFFAVATRALAGLKQALEA
jgi:hypothetical protein